MVMQHMKYTQNLIWSLFRGNKLAQTEGVNLGHSHHIVIITGKMPNSSLGTE